MASSTSGTATRAPLSPNSAARPISTTAAAAPLVSAWPTKLCPSRTSLSAKNRSPWTSVLVSMETPVIGRKSPASRAPGRPARSDAVQRNALINSTPQGRTDDLVVRERQCALADDLARFMTFAGNHQYVARPETANGGADRLGAVADLARNGRGREDLGPDRGGILRARIIIGHDHGIGLLGRDRPHDRPLAPVAIAA